MGKPIDRSALEGKSIEIFRAAVKSRKTLDPYERRLVSFLKNQSMTCDEFVRLARKNRDKAEQLIINFVIKERKRAESREIANVTVPNRIKPVKLLLEMNDVVLNWKKIKKLMPSHRRYALDRIPSIEELREIVEHDDGRGKALTLLLCSSGIREGAIEMLRMANLTPIQVSDRIYGRLVAYEGDEEQYITFTTAEAYEAVGGYLSWRKVHGEEVGPDSPLFRDKFDATLNQKFLTYGGGIPERPKPLDGAAVRSAYNRLFHELGFRKGAKRRHDFTVHGFRKWFKTRMENGGAKPIVTELLMGHSVGISDSYYRPFERELFDDYLKASDNLVILEKNHLKKLNEEQRLHFEDQLTTVHRKVDELISRFAGSQPLAK